MRGGWVYIMTNRPNGTLYTGVTNDLSRRAYEHRTGLYQGFTKQYGLTRLVYLERYDDIRAAIQRERNMKHWPRAWKVRLILKFNPDWRDLYEMISLGVSTTAWMAGTSPAMTREIDGRAAGQDGFPSLCRHGPASLSRPSTNPQSPFSTISSRWISAARPGVPRGFRSRLNCARRFSSHRRRRNWRGRGRVHGPPYRG